MLVGVWVCCVDVMVVFCEIYGGMFVVSFDVFFVSDFDVVYIVMFYDSYVQYMLVVLVVGKVVLCEKFVVLNVV